MQHTPVLFTKRNIWMVVLLTIVTGGIYTLYWLIRTKTELKRYGYHIPTAWVWLIPIVGFIWYVSNFSRAYCAVLFDDESPRWPYFFLLLLITCVAPVVMQHEINTFIEQNR